MDEEKTAVRSPDRETETTQEQKPKKKKPYSKPEIWFEDFTLSTQISAGCEVKAVNQMYACATGGNDNRLNNNLFNSSIPGCIPPYVTPNMEGGLWNGRRYPCYEVYTDNNNVFNS